MCVCVCILTLQFSFRDIDINTPAAFVLPIIISKVDTTISISHELFILGY